jgi:hypothetical protein
MKTKSVALPPKTVRELDRRARVSLNLASDRSFQNGSAGAIACELNRQAVYWALLALREIRKPNSTEGASLVAPFPTLAELWAGAEASLLARAAGGEAEAQAVGSQVREATFADLAELNDVARERLTLDLGRVASAIILEMDAADREVDRIWMRRVVRIGGILAMGAMLAVAIPRLPAWIVEHRDLGRGRPWVASSRFAEGGCVSPFQSCPDSPSYFFHTLEEDNPWLSIDLQSIRRVSGVEVINRSDCCSDRAVPLVVEVSIDQKRWRQVARRNADFTDWKSMFAPTPARWVRLSVRRRTFLHLQEVRVR